MDLEKIITISRPRFWIYLLGPFLVGLAAVYPGLKNIWLLVLFGLYVTLPANLLVYGINDIFDYETDKQNPKKENYESKITPQERNEFWVVIIITNLPFLILAWFLPVFAQVSLGAFLFFGIFYSAEPIRAKTIPFLDSFFNILYLFPGYVGYFLAGGSGFNWKIFLAGVCWVMAMHAYSAVPDIEADKKVSIKTIATKLGGKNTIYFCLLLYSLSAILTVSYLGYISLSLWLVYAGLMIISIVNFKQNKLMKIYKVFPVINLISGFLIFLYVLQ